MQKLTETTRHWSIVLALTLAAVISWNYWLPIAEDFYNLVTPADENRQYALRNVDFFAYYNAGVRYENGSNPYFYNDSGLKNFSDYIYPPTLLPLYGLLSKLEYDQARLLWLGLYFTAYALCFTILLIAVRKDNRPILFTCGVVLTAASFPLLMHIHNGQSDVLVISLVLIGYAAYIKGFKTSSAFLFALAALTKVSPVLFLIYFVIFLKDYRFLLTFCLWATGMVLVSLLSVPFSLYTDYLFQVLPEIGKGTTNWLNQSIVKFVPVSQAGLARVISVVGFVMFGLFAWWLSKHLPSSMRTTGKILGENHFVSESVFILNILIILVFSGKAWSMVYVWMIFPAALLTTHLIKSRPKTWYLLLNCVAVFLLASKVYGYPILDSLNLWGNLILSMLLVINLMKVEWAFNEIHYDPLPLTPE
ncbi:MAG: hypothetical protein A2Z71_01215 [Chloroflexi bacterium RBG_13_50_21]|nr:MAG: hypothetical protein A2Z71_01215 [Chloroflexi bacterium RBG_13_50_21]